MPIKNKPTPVKSVPKACLPEYKIKIENFTHVLNAEDDEETYSVSITNTITCKRIFFTFYLDQLPHCCAIKELGDFTIDYSKLSIIEKEQVINGIKTIIIALYESSKNLNSEYTLMINLNNNFVCGLVREALQQIEVFTLVKSFTNTNTDNPIEIWISN